MSLGRGKLQAERHPWCKTKYGGKEAKVETFSKNHFLFKSLPLHERALKSGIRLPEIYKIEYKDDLIYKYTEWIKGEDLGFEFKHNSDNIYTICKSLAIYINNIYDIDGMSVRDTKLENFVWHNNEVICIDIKFLMYTEYDYHINNMVKLCLYDFKADRETAIIFLKEYLKHREVQSILEACEIRNWKWFNKMDPITIGDIK